MVYGTVTAAALARDGFHDVLHRDLANIHHKEPTKKKRENICKMNAIQAWKWIKIYHNRSILISDSIFFSAVHFWSLFLSKVFFFSFAAFALVSISRIFFFCTTSSACADFLYNNTQFMRKLKSTAITWSFYFHKLNWKC